MTRSWGIASLMGGMVLMIGCSPSVRHMEPLSNKDRVQVPTTFDHSLFDAVVQQYVDDGGWVDYAGLKRDRALDPYLEQISQTRPDGLSEAGQIAFWINVYNATTLKLIASNYPTSSILRLAPRGLFGFHFHIPRANDVFRATKVNVGGDALSLHDMEHEILRKHFDEPRIHFALVCGALSCPPLRNQAFTADRLDAQLDEQGRIFLHDTTKNKVDADGTKIYLSKIFKWFKEDFGGTDASLQHFLASYFSGEVRQKLAAAAFRISYMRYDWSLNAQDVPAS